VFELVLALLLGGVGLALLAPRLGVPWPALLALAGAALAFVPGMPEVALQPELAFALFVAPVLLDAGGSGKNLGQAACLSRADRPA
jgi:NhaP-type Na+/H+ or K+/H+ antiporter